jgi:DeoR family transcriptional regulator, copper-sensing transcriptional repressor
MATAHQRQQKILSYLEQAESCTIQELADLLSVSPMTIHRDLDKLVGQGVVKKVHGGVALPHLVGQPSEAENRCQMCQQEIRPQLAFVLQFDNDTPKQACCPHCGLMMSTMQNPAMMLATDFLHGNKVNALQATYLLEPELSTCCFPPVVAFAAREDALRFQRGFGGEMMSFSEARTLLSSTHALPGEH